MAKSDNPLSVADLQNKASSDPTVIALLSAFEAIMERQAAQFQETIKTVVSEIRKPPVDPIKEIQKAREKVTKEKAEKEMWDKVAWAKTHCSHLREDGTSNIAWAVQSDNIERGFCPYCKSMITPDDGELYKQLRLIPRGRKENVRMV